MSQGHAVQKGLVQRPHVNYYRVTILENKLSLRRVRSCVPNYRSTMRVSSSRFFSKKSKPIFPCKCWCERKGTSFPTISMLKCTPRVLCYIAWWHGIKSVVFSQFWITIPFNPVHKWNFWGSSASPASKNRYIKMNKLIKIKKKWKKLL